LQYHLDLLLLPLLHVLVIWLFSLLLLRQLLLWLLL
jgi:hypothetical protein